MIITHRSEDFPIPGSLKPTSEIRSRVLIRLCKQPIDQFRE